MRRLQGQRPGCLHCTRPLRTGQAGRAPPGAWRKSLTSWARPLAWTHIRTALFPLSLCSGTHGNKWRARPGVGGGGGRTHGNKWGWGWGRGGGAGQRLGPSSPGDRVLPGSGGGAVCEQLPHHSLGAQGAAVPETPPGRPRNGGGDSSPRPGPEPQGVGTTGVASGVEARSASSPGHRGFRHPQEVHVTGQHREVGVGDRRQTRPGVPVAEKHVHDQLQARLPAHGLPKEEDPLKEQRHRVRVQGARPAPCGGSGETPRDQRRPGPVVRSPWQGHGSHSSPARASHLFPQASRAQGGGSRGLPPAPHPAHATEEARDKTSSGPPRMPPPLTAPLPSPPTGAGLSTRPPQHLPLGPGAQLGAGGDPNGGPGGELQ